MQWNRLVVNLWSKMSLFCSMKEGVSDLFLSATTYLLFCHVQPPPRSAVPHVCCRPSNGRKMQALTAVEWLTAVRYETDGRLANGWTDGLPENRLTGLGAGLPLTYTLQEVVDLVGNTHVGKNKRSFITRRRQKGGFSFKSDVL